MAVSVEHIANSGIIVGLTDTAVTKDLVTERFVDVKASSDVAQAAAITAINSLTTLFSTADMPV